uniref:Uncharacterized protein n=1 Tax=Bionectria ochroleuca TaxID=29856 RepID=A0A8H7TTF3_BIOOC
MDSRHACMQLTKSQHPPPKNQAQGCGVCLCLWRCPAPPGEDAVGDQGWALCHPMVPSCITSHPTGPIKHTRSERLIDPPPHVGGAAARRKDAPPTSSAMYLPKSTALRGYLQMYLEFLYMGFWKRLYCR